MARIQGMEELMYADAGKDKPTVTASAATPVAAGNKRG